MNKNIYFYFLSYLAFHVLSIVPEWDLDSVGDDLFENKNENEITVIINERNLFNVKMTMKKRIKKTENGFDVTNWLSIDNTEKEVEFDQVESYYKIFGTYIVCPKGNKHPYNFNEEKDFIPDDFVSAGNWDLRCYWHQNSEYFLVFYLMNGGDVNVYLTYDRKVDWYNGAGIEESITKETYDFLLKSKKEDGIYQMIALLKEENNLTLEYLAYTLEKNEGNQHANSKGKRGIIEKNTYTQAYFKNSTDKDKYFYYFTYDNISNFKTGYSTSAINEDKSYKDEIVNVEIKKNEEPHLEFFDDMIIEKINFLLNNKFLYYEMKTKNTNEIYFGIFDIELNKIIFNTKENILKFIPYSDNSMFAITNTKAYRICAYKNNTGCTDTCSDQYILDIDGNTCGDKCSDGKYLFIPSGVCINECDETYYIKIESKKTCGLCRDMSDNSPYKFINGTECLNQIPVGAYISNTKLNLLSCSEGYHYENNNCIKNCYVLCSDCTEGSDNPDDQKCVNCIGDFVKDDKNNCRCRQGYKINGITCEQCGTQNNCKTYKINLCDCDTCNEGYYLKDNKCDPCDSNCKNCNITATNCTECKNNFFLEENKCYECTDCKETVDSQTCKCKLCNERFYLDSYQCKHCKEHCKKCENGNECSICDQFYKLENSECNDCSSDIKCNTTLDNTCKCSSCNQSYFLYNNECINCIDETQCKEYEEDKCKCKECKEGFYLDSYQCKHCKEHCKTCKNGNECSSCDQFYKLDKSGCEKCPSNIKCETTKENECNCKSCNESYFLHDDECINCIDQTQCKTYKDNKTCECEECKEGFYKDDYLCKQCNDICLTCDGGFDGNLDYHCLSCKNGSEYPYLLIDDKKHICVKNCSDYNAITNTEKNICEFPKDETDGGGQGGNGEGEADYMLWIFVSIIGILLILVSICICKRFICRKSSDDIELINEMEGELTEK